MEKRMTTKQETLPQEIPLLMMRGLILLPKADFKIPILEECHVDLLERSLHQNTHIGLIQPHISLAHKGEVESLQLFTTGCLSRILKLYKDQIGCYVAHLEGICRFKLLDVNTDAEDHPVATVNYANFTHDLVSEIDFQMDRKRLFEALGPYLNRLDIKINWEEIKESSNLRLLSTLSLACPLEPSEKQILLETSTFKEQSELMMKLIEMSSFSTHNGVTVYH